MYVNLDQNSANYFFFRKLRAFALGGYFSLIEPKKMRIRKFLKFFGIKFEKEGRLLA